MLYFFVSDGNIRLVGAQLFIVFDPDGRHHFKAGFEAHGFAVVHVQIGYARLRYRHQSQFVGFLAEVARHQRIHHIALDAFGKALLNNGGGGMAGAEAGDAGQLLILLDQGLGFAGNVGGRDLHLDLPFGAAGLSGAHVYLSVCPPADSGANAQFGPPPSPRRTVLSVKTEGEKRQTPEGVFQAHFGTLVTAAHGRRAVDILQANHGIG